MGLLGLYVCVSFREFGGLTVFAVGFGFIVLVCLLATVSLVFCFVGYWWVWFVSGSLCGVCVIACCFYV